MMTLKHQFDLLCEIWQAYRPWLPLRTVKEFLTVAGHPRDALLGGGHWVAIAGVAVAAAVLLVVSRAVPALTGVRAHRLAC